MLGHLVRHGEIRPSDPHVDSIRQFNVPQNVTEILRFLGVINISITSATSRTRHVRYMLFWKARRGIERNYGSAERCMCQIGAIGGELNSEKHSILGTKRIDQRSWYLLGQALAGGWDGS
jgi:hypothetical protein